MGRFIASEVPRVLLLNTASEDCAELLLASGLPFRAVAESELWRATHCHGVVLGVLVLRKTLLICYL